MDVFVTRHAIERYRQRLFDFKASDEAISEILKEIALKGKDIGIRRDHRNNCLEKKYKGVSIVSMHNQTKIVVLTCLGETSYRNWVKCNNAAPPISLGVLKKCRETQYQSWGLLSKVT